MESRAPAPPRATQPSSDSCGLRSLATPCRRPGVAEMDGPRPESLRSPGGCVPDSDAVTPDRQFHSRGCGRPCYTRRARLAQSQADEQRRPPAGMGTDVQTTGASGPEESGRAGTATGKGVREQRASTTPLRLCASGEPSGPDRWRRGFGDLRSGGPRTSSGEDLFASRPVAVATILVIGAPPAPC